MKEKIKNTVKRVIEKESNVITEENWTIEYGYDFISIKFMGNIDSLFFEILTGLKEELSTDICWITLNDGEFRLCYDISNLILQEYGDWDTYNKQYEEWE